MKAIVNDINLLGTVRIKMLKGERGDPGLTVTGASINAHGHLIITLNSGTQIDAGEVSNNVFWAEYGVSAYADITAAVAAGKLPLCNYLSTLYLYRGVSGGYHRFVGWTTDNRQVVMSVDTTDTWTVSATVFENTANKTTTIGPTSTDDQYPTAKAVYDYAVEIYWCECHGIADGTNGADITAAVAAGKLPILVTDYYPYKKANDGDLYAFYCGVADISGVSCHVFLSTHGNKLYKWSTRTDGGAWMYNRSMLDNVEIFERNSAGVLTNSDTVYDIFSAYYGHKRIVKLKVNGELYELKTCEQGTGSTYTMTFVSTNYSLTAGADEDVAVFSWIALENVDGTTTAIPEPQTRTIDLNQKSMTAVYTTSYSNNQYHLDNGKTLNDLYHDFAVDNKIVYVIQGGYRYKLEECRILNNAITLSFDCTSYGYDLGNQKHEIWYHYIKINGGDVDSDVIPSGSSFYVYPG